MPSTCRAQNEPPTHTATHPLLMGTPRMCAPRTCACTHARCYSHEVHASYQFTNVCLADALSSFGYLISPLPVSPLTCVTQPYGRTEYLCDRVYMLGACLLPIHPCVTPALPLLSWPYLIAPLLGSHAVRFFGSSSAAAAAAAGSRIATPCAVLRPMQASSALTTLA